MKNKALTLTVFYLIGLVLLLILSFMDLYNNPLLWTCLFTVAVLINRISLNFSKIKETKKFIYLTEACFIVYTILLFVWGNTNFTLYKLLIIPSVILSSYYVFKFKRVQKNKSSSL